MLSADPADDARAARSVDPIFAAVTGPGSPFEIGEREGMRQFVSAPPDLNTLVESARRFGDATFLVDLSNEGSERRLTFAELFAARDALVAQLGIEPGDRVAICMRNCAEWVVAFLAIIAAGATAALLNSRGSSKELVAMIDGVTPTLVLADEERAGLIRDGGYRGRVIDVADPQDLAQRSITLNETVAQAATANQPCAILFTSGTTAQVKGAVLTHRNLIHGLMATQLTGTMVLHNVAAKHGITPEAVIAMMPQQGTLLVTPLFHISGLGSGFLSPLMAGMKVVIMRRWVAGDAAAIIEREHITQLSGVPTMLWDMLSFAKAGAVDLSTLTNIASGGQTLPVNLLDAIRQLCPHAVIGTGYGMTECSGAIAQAVGEDLVRARGTVGRVISLADVRVVRDDGSIAAASDSGEIQVRGPMVMAGYWDQPEETEAAFTPDGWLRTGDIGMIDAEGHMFIVDRKKDMVISGGENIFCAEVERALGAMPGVVECAAFGVPDERMGEKLVVILVAEGCVEADAKAWVGERLARYKIPARVSFAAGALPRNQLGKIDKRLLRGQWLAGSGEI